MQISSDQHPPHFLCPYEIYHGRTTIVIGTPMAMSTDPTMALFGSAAPSAPPGGVDDAYDSNGQEAREREIEGGGGGAPTLRLSVSSQIPTVYLLCISSHLSCTSHPQNSTHSTITTGHRSPADRRRAQHPHLLPHRRVSDWLLHSHRVRSTSLLRFPMALPTITRRTAWGNGTHHSTHPGSTNVQTTK